MLALASAACRYAQDDLRPLDGGGLRHAGLVTRELDARRSERSCSPVIIFVYRAMPTVGHGYTWCTLDVLGFDEAFQGVLRQTGAGWRSSACGCSEADHRCSVAQVLLWLAIARRPVAAGVRPVHSACTTGPSNIRLRRPHHRHHRHGAASPFAQLSMIPLLTLIAIYAPAGHRATWFALMASLMNLALVAGQLQTKYLNEIFVVGRGDYTALGAAVDRGAAPGFVLPVGAIIRLAGALCETDRTSYFLPTGRAGAEPPWRLQEDDAFIARAPPGLPERPIAGKISAPGRSSCNSA